MMLHLSTFLLAATLGQAPAETGWLDAVPAEADVVIRVRGMEPVRKDVVAMLKAMSPTVGAQAEPALEQAINGFKAQFGEPAANESYLSIFRAVTPENPSQPPFAMVVKSKEFDAVVKAVAGGNAPTLKHEEGGYDSFDGPNGGTWYVAKRGEIIACGPDKVLIAGFAKPGKPSFTKGLSAACQAKFASGDIGLCVNVGALTTRYAEQIDQGKKGFMAAIDQAGRVQGGAGMMDMVKTIYGGLFDSVKEADVLTLAIDFSAGGLGLDGELAVKPDSAAAKSIAAGQSSDAATMAKLPADAAYYVYFNLDSATFETFQRMGMRMMSPNGKPSPEFEAALAKQRGLGRIETTSATSVSQGMRSINIMKVSDPKALLATTEASINAMGSFDSPVNFFKEIKVIPNAETYKGYTFNRTEMVIDKEKMAKLQPGNPNAAAGLTAIYGGDKITSWYGINDTQVIQLMDSSWDKAKAQLDAYLKGDEGIGANPSYQAIRDKLPKQVNVLFLMSAQGLVNQLATQFAGMMNNPNLKAPADMPKEAALIGASLSTNAPSSFEFHLVVPSSVGAVIEKGMIPLFQSLRPPGN